MKELVLRPYQEDVLTSLRQGFIEGHRAQILYGATGFGKTETAIALLVATMEKGNRALFVADRRVLVDQISERMDSYGIDHGIMMAGHWRWRPSCAIQVCSAQTLSRMDSLPNVSLLISDEAHRQRKQIVDVIRGRSSLKAIGLTATPFTKGLGSIYTRVATAMTTAKIVERGDLVPLRYFIAKQVDMTGAKKIAGEWRESEAAERGIKITGDVVAEWVKKTHELFGGPRKTIVFCAGVAHGRDLAEKFAQAGYNFLALSYKDDDQFKRDAIEEFRKPDSEIMGLIATDILTAGFDVPDAMIGVLARPFSRSLSSHIQQIGRIMRPYPGKEFGVIIDHAGNVLRFREQWEDVYDNGVHEMDDEKEKPQREPTEREKEAAKCPKCSAMWPRNSDVCACCGHVRERRNDVIEVAGEVVELGSRKATKDDKQLWYSCLMHHARRSGYADGWASHQYRAKFGVWPRGLMTMTTEPTPEIASWIKSRIIRYKYSRAA